MRLIIIHLLAISIFSSCNNVYKAGNLDGLSYPIETKLREEIILQYLDTIIQINGSEVPEKLLQYDKLINIDSVKNRRIYFKSQPEEMYLLSFGGMLILMDVYNPAIRGQYWVTDRALISNKEEERIKKRLKQEVLDKVENFARADGLPDSVIYQ